MEGDDPYKWSVDQVCRFFRDDAQKLLDSIPNIPPLPPLPHFLEILRENDVSGFVLLTSVATSDLRDDFGIKSFGQRSSLIHCINQLRERHAAYDELHERKNNPDNATSTSALQEQSSSKTLATEQISSRPTRDGETQVHDKHGRKRRKLNLSAATTTSPTISLVGSENGYFGNTSMPVDSLFFSKTQLGREIEHLEPGEFSVFDTDRSNDASEHNFQFHGLQKLAGEAQYVYQQTYRFLQQEPTYLTRRGYQALAIAPYREELSVLVNKVRSAIVIQYADNSDFPLAMRENVAYLSNGGDYNGIAQESALGQFDYLNEKYGGDGGQDDSDTESISSSAFDQIQADIDAEWADEKAELEASQAKKLSKDDIKNIIDETVDSFIHQWTVNKLPSKDKNQAWSIWKMMKRSKIRRDGLIEGAKAKIDSFSRRLDRQKSHVVKAECCTQDEVVKLCEALKVTVTDREEQKWRIRVWQRRDEPDHVVRPGHQNGARNTTAAEQTHHSFVPHPEDRLSVEPAPASALDVQEDVFVTPRGSPTVLPGEADEEAFDGSDEASKLEDFIEEDMQSLSGPPLEDSTTHSRDEYPASPSTPPSVHESRRKRARSRSASSSDADRLPTMASFFTQTPKKTPKNKHKFSKPSEPASASRQKASIVIEISSDSACTPNSKGRKGDHGRTKVESLRDSKFNSMPENSTASDVDSWEIEDLLNKVDRKRLIIKLLHGEGTLGIFRIKSLWINRAMVGFKRDVLNLFKLIRDDPQTAHAQPGPLLQSARLAIVWSSLHPDIMKGIYPQELDWHVVERDLRLFMSFFAVLMQKSDSKLFAEHAQSPTPSPSVLPRASTPELIEIDSDTSIETPHARRKRRVKYSQKAVESQHIALERHERYKAAETQSSNSHQLLGMIGQSNELLPIDLTKEVEGAHYIHPAIAPSMKEHQINGVRFMWRELTAGAAGAEDGQGCVLAHAMGLGKTMQTITLLVAVVEAAQSPDPLVSSQLPSSLRPAEVAQKERSLRVLVLCPPSLLENWRREIDQWSHGRLGSVYIVDAASKNAQMDNLRYWNDFGGVLLMGYSLFNKRVNRTKAEEKAGESNKDGPLLDKYLLQGPEILVADEAHNIKNIKAGVSRAVNNIQTKSRIALTGTPMSNDVSEMYALISFVAPGFLGGPLEFKAKFGEPIEQGTYADSTSYEQRRSKVKLSTLSRLIEPKIDRADITVMKGTLQPKVEFVVTLPLTDLQRSVYNRYLDALLGEGKNDKASQVTLFSWLAILSLLTNHPLAFKRKLNEAQKPRKGDAEKPSKGDGGSASPIAVDDDDGAEAGPDYEEIGLKTLGFSDATVQHITADITDSTDPTLSAKMDILMDILALSKECGDKVLVFSSSIPTLNYVGELLHTRGTKFGRICGSVIAAKRLRIIAEFTNGLTEVLIVSTKAGGVGLNIQAANRVVILDFGFNPAHEEQAIGRAYRFGQLKPVFVYRLIAGGTFEDNIYNKQLFKTSLTQRVVDKKNPRRNAARSTRHYLYPPNEVPQQDLQEWMGKDPQVFDKLLTRQLDELQGFVRKLTTIETLQREGDDLPLNAEELRQAEEEYQMSIAAAMGPRGQVASLENIPGFAAAQARAVPAASSRVRLSQQQAGIPSRMVRLPGQMPLVGPPSTAPGGPAPRPGPRLDLRKTNPAPIMPHGLSHGHPGPSELR